MELLIGCGSTRDKRVWAKGMPKEWIDLVTLDKSPDVGANIVHDLDVFPYPFGDGMFDEIHAYDVLEHCGTQGDDGYFFGQFKEFWRILKDRGHFCFIVPMWNHPLAWGVPDHKRCLPKDIFAFLDRDYYADLGKPGTNKADYRHLLGPVNFKVIGFREEGEHLSMILQKWSY